MNRFLVGAGLVIAVFLGSSCRTPAQHSGAGGAMQWHFAGTGSVSKNGGDGSAIAKAFRVGLAEEAARLFVTNFSRTLYGFARGSTNVPADALAGFSPVMREFLQGESIGELDGRVDGAAVWAVAARVDGAKGAAWAKAAEAFLGGKVVQRSGPGGWVVLGTGKKLMDTVEKRAGSSGETGLLKADLDLGKFPSEFWPSHVISAPVAHLSMSVTNGRVRTLVNLRFREELPMRLEAWNVPTSVVRDPLVSFAAARGVDQLVAKMEWFKFLNGATPPSQLFLWSQPQVPFQVFVAGLVPDAEKFVDQSALRLRTVFTGGTNPPPTVMGELMYDTNKHRILIDRTPAFIPAMFALRTNQAEWVVGGLFPSMRSTRPPPAELLQQLEGAQRVAYEWESTEEGFKHWIPVFQAREIASFSPSLTTVNGPVHRWVEAVAPQLGECVTQVDLKGPRELQILRNSGVGLSGFELSHLARWIDASVSRKANRVNPGVLPPARQRP